VLTAVDLDNQARLAANKIRNVMSERCSSAESVTFDLTRSQYLPKAPLGFGHLVS
jgi:hypothetical protein